MKKPTLSEWLTGLSLLGTVFGGISFASAQIGEQNQAIHEAGKQNDNLERRISDMERDLRDCFKTR